MASEFTLEVAKYPKSILPQQQFRECANLLFTPLVMQTVNILPVQLDVFYVHVVTSCKKCIFPRARDADNVAL